jgi:hypothetical protein
MARGLQRRCKPDSAWAGRDGCGRPRRLRACAARSAQQTQRSAQCGTPAAGAAVTVARARVCVCACVCARLWTVGYRGCRPCPRSPPRSAPGAAGRGTAGAGPCDTRRTEKPPASLRQPKLQHTPKRAGARGCAHGSRAPVVEATSSEAHERTAGFSRPTPVRRGPETPCGRTEVRTRADYSAAGEGCALERGSGTHVVAQPGSHTRGTAPSARRSAAPSLARARRAPRPARRAAQPT